MSKIKEAQDLKPGDRVREDDRTYRVIDFFYYGPKIQIEVAQCDGRYSEIQVLRYARSEEVEVV